MKRILMVMVIAAILVMALAAPAFAGNAKGQNNTNNGYYHNNYNKWCNGSGYDNGSDVFNDHGNGDWRN